MNDNIATKEEMKKHAIECLQKLGIYKPYINDFKAKKQWVTMFERYVGFWAYQYPELDKKIKEIEEHFGGIVYAVTHEFAEFGELYDLHWVSKYKADWQYDVEEVSKDTYNVFAYVWNKTDDDLSEFGTIGVRSVYGGITRIW